MSSVHYIVIIVICQYNLRLLGSCHLLSFFYIIVVPYNLYMPAAWSSSDVGIRLEIESMD